jgi:predicted dehydrogenase
MEGSKHRSFCLVKRKSDEEYFLKFRAAKEEAVGVAENFEAGRPVRAGIIGTGFSGRLQARSVRVAGGIVTGVAASSPERSKAAAEELGGRPYDSGEALIEADDIDVVHVCAPNALHEPLAAAALAAGKHVICEKPLAMDAAGAQRLTDAAQQAGTVASVPFVYRFHPVVREARARVAAGELGPLRLLHGSYLQDWLLGEADWNWRVDPAQGGASRTFADIGSHWCDLVEFVTGHRITRVVARTATVIPERVRADHAETFTTTTQGERTAVSTEDLATVLFETDQGASGSVVVSQVSAGRKNRLWFELDGADASVVFDQEEPEKLWLSTRDHNRLIVRDASVLSPEAGRYAYLPGGHAQGYADCFDAFVADTYAAVRQGVAPDGLPQFADGLRAAKITDAVLESAKSRTEVEVTS